MVKHFHQQLKAVLRARCSRAAWQEHLPWVLLGLCAAPKEEAGVSAAEATYGHSLVLPSQLQQPSCAPQAILPSWSSPVQGSPPRRQRKRGRRLPTYTCMRGWSSILVPQSILHAHLGEEEAAVGGGSCSDMGLCRPSETACGCGDPSSGTAIPTRPPTQDLTRFFVW